MGHWVAVLLACARLRKSLVCMPETPVFPETRRRCLSSPTPPPARTAATMQWRDHQPKAHAQPGPDFKAMNKKAADRCEPGTGRLELFTSGVQDPCTQQERPA